MPNVVGHEHTLAEESMAVCMGEADMLCQGKHCSLHAVCVNPEHGHPLESQLLISMGHKQPCETVFALTFLFGFSIFFFSSGIVWF